MITTSTEWDALANVPGNIIAVARLHYGDGANYVRVAEEDVTIDGEFYIGALKTIPTVRGSFDWRKHTSSIGGGSITLSNVKWDRLERPSDLVEDDSLGSGSDIGFYRRLVEIKFYRKGISSWANCFPHFSGVMEPVGHGRDVFTIAVKDKGDDIKLRKIAGTKITAADLVEFDQTQGDGELGESKPSDFGDKKSGFCHSDASLTNFVRSKDAFKMRFMGTKVTGETIYQISDRQIDMQEAAAYRIFAHEPTIDRFVELSTASWEIIQNDNNGCLIEILVTALYWDYRLAASVSKSESNGGDGSGVVTDEANMVDQDNATTGTLFVNDSTTPGKPHARVTIGYEVMSDPESSIGLVFVPFVRSSYVEDFGTGAIFEVNGIDASGNGAANYIAYGTIASGTSTILADATGGENEGAAANHTSTIHMSYLRCQFRPLERLDHFAACGGGEYGDWINSRAGHQDNNAAAVKKSGNDLTKIGGATFRSAAGGFTAAGVTAGDILTLDDAVGGGRLKVKSKISDIDIEVYGNYTDVVTSVDFAILTSAVVENAAGGIEYILREYGALVDADIDEDAFDTASVPVASLLFAGGLVTEVLIPRALAEIGEAFGLYPFWGGGNKYRCVAMKAIYTDADVTQDVPYADMKKFDFNGKTISTDLKVASVLGYGWNGNEFTKRTDGVTSTANIEKYNIDAESAEYELLSKYISDGTSADTQETYNLNLRMQPHNLPKVGLGLLYLALEMGDILSMSDLVDAEGLPLLVNGEDVEQESYTRNGQTIYGMFMVTGYRRNRRIDLDGFQLHRLS